MHAFRWELILEGSDDGASWHAYGWRYKPWSATVAPRAGDVRLTARAPGLGAAHIDLRVVS